jgi:hypothetical protein
MNIFKNLNLVISREKTEELEVTNKESIDKENQPINN